MDVPFPFLTPPSSRAGPALVKNASPALRRLRRTRGSKDCRSDLSYGEDPNLAKTTLNDIRVPGCFAVRCCEGPGRETSSLENRPAHCASTMEDACTLRVP